MRKIFCMLYFSLCRPNRNGGNRTFAIAILGTVLFGWYSPVFAANPSLLTPDAKPGSNWPVYGGENAEDHYSPLAQINRKNVDKLRVAWTVDTGERDGM